MHQDVRKKKKKKKKKAITAESVGPPAGLS